MSTTQFPLTPEFPWTETCTRHWEEMREGAKTPAELASLSEDEVWSSSSELVWRSENFVGTPAFYPVYRWEDLYSFSPLPLIAAKNRLVVSSSMKDLAAGNHFRYLPPPGCLDREIQRVGGAISSTESITKSSDYIQAVADAMREDCLAREQEGSHNLILCGGKDSLNLLLLPWKQRTKVLSAAPNTDLVRNFVRDNQLDLEVVELKDPEDKACLVVEILENGSRNNLAHCRWMVHLRELAKEHGQVIFWKGQLADLFLTPKWREVVHPHTPVNRLRRRVTLGAESLFRRESNTALREEQFRQVMWQRGAMWQGAHCSLIRGVTKKLVLSGYHGPAMRKVYREVSLRHCVDRDLRDEIGEALLGRRVIYPTENPGPPPSVFREQMHLPGTFLELLESLGVSISS